MKVKCTLDDINSIDSRLHEFAFTQNPDGKVDLTVGKIYQVYGLRTNQYGNFYLVLTDEDNTILPWWMPSAFFEITDRDTPPSWVTEGGVDSDGQPFSYTAHPDYFDAEEDIEDGTYSGRKAFESIRRDAEASSSG